ncbi:MAG: YbhB/YbcL family Raf kinase inhibitor-like protein [Candidatus Omnitrophica bacterium]|nr:YbhB/YbcL family Raf kinase inhibitor-like protein [Candidatus Omnitrophota bacterium]
MNKKIALLLLAVFLAFSFAQAQEGGIKMKISSPEFQNNQLIPKKFTCQGDDINPALIIRDIPAGAETLALIMDDPDAPMGTWVHWVVFNIPLITEIQEDSIPGEQAMNNFGRADYGGPCPPAGTHRYFFKIYALDAQIDPGLVHDKKSLEKAMQTHILANAELIGLYKKQ